jgi:hypothetical protein
MVLPGCPQRPLHQTLVRLGPRLHVVRLWNGLNLSRTVFSRVPAVPAELVAREQVRCCCRMACVRQGQRNGANWPGMPSGSRRGAARRLAHPLAKQAPRGAAGMQILVASLVARKRDSQEVDVRVA